MNILKSLIEKIKNELKNVNKMGLILVILVIIAGTLYYFRDLFIVATVNGQPITRFAVIQKLEASGGKSTLDGMVTEILINQQAKLKNIVVSPQEVQADLNKIKASLQGSGQTLDQALASQGMTLAQLEDNRKITLTVDKLLADKLTVTDQEVATYIEQNKASLPANYVLADIKPTIVDQLKQEKFATEFQKWLDQIKKSSSINYLIKY